jgi:D-alanyl-D-alanine carboxypeptidase (penicillin-binding protein 5/6)
LLYGLLLPSGNDAAVAIARNLAGSSEAFVDRANARITELGLNDTALINPHGLDAHLHYSSARDLAAATLFVLRTQPDFARISGALDHTAEGHELYQTNDLHVTYPGLIAGKTGVTDEAGFCLMEVAERNGQRVITVLLGSTPDAWYADAEILLDFGFATLATPGRLPATDVISIGNPVPATVENATTTQSNASTIAQPQSQIQPSTSLQVVPVGQNTALVNEPAIADAARRSPWLWLMLPVIAVPAMLFALLQASQIATRGSRRTRRAADSALSVPEAVSRSISPWETAQFTEVPSRPAPSSARYATPLHEDDDSDLHLIWDRATRERLLRGRPALNVSIGD